jgi:hypothetical protein
MTCSEPSIIPFAWGKVTSWGKDVSVTFPCDGVLQKYNAGVLAHTEENAAVAIVELLSSEARRGELCECAFEYLSKNHTPEQTLVKFEELINE